MRREIAHNSITLNEVNEIFLLKNELQSDDEKWVQWDASELIEIYCT